MTVITDANGRGSAPSMVDVARHAGVALGTVSNVLNNPSKVAEQTRRRVLASIEALGFVRNSLAQGLATGSARTLGFVIVDIGNSLFVDIARGAQAAFEEHDMKLLLANSDVDLSNQNGYLDLFDEARVRGILLAPLDAPLDGAEKVRSHGRPVVLANWPGEPGASCGVVVDEELGGYIAARHLLESGRTRLMFAGGPLQLRAVKQRYAGMQRAVTEWDADVSVELLETTRLTVPAGLEVGRAITSRAAADRPDGIFASADALAAGCVQALLYGGIDVPTGIAVIGYDNNHFASDSVVPISTVGQPGWKMGQIAAALLLEETQALNTHEHRTVVLAPDLFVRASTRSPAIQNAS